MDFIDTIALDGGDISISVRERIAAERVAGRSLAVIAAMLNEEQVPTAQGRSSVVAINGARRAARVRRWSSPELDAV